MELKVDQNAGGVTRDEGRTGVSFVIVDNPAKEACDPDAGTVTPSGPSVDDLVTFLEGLPLIDISENRTSRSMAIAGRTWSTRSAPRRTNAAGGDGRMADELAA